MLSFLPAPFLGAFALSLMTLNTLLVFVPLFALALLKLIPILPLRKALDVLLNGLATWWIGVNNAVHALTKKIDWQVEGVDDLAYRDWYLVLANHQSWADILVLQKVFNQRIPFMKFFLKQQLIWVPVLGICWWALDFPFMKRFSKSYLAANPHMKGKDMETTRRACEKFRRLPVSIMNFVEGTRFTAEKHRRSQSPFTHLLKPKSGGAGYVLTAMGDQLHRVLDVTIVYGESPNTFWDFLCGRVKRISVHVRALPITDELRGNYEDDNQYRVRFQAWLNQLWQEKDARIAAQKKRFEQA